MEKVVLLVPMVRATDVGPQEYAQGDTMEVPADHVQRLVDRRLAKRAEQAPKERGK